MVRANVMARSGHAVTHAPQARQASAFGVKAVLRPWAQSLNLTSKGMAENCSSGMRPMSNTSNGQATAQSPLPSQRSGSTIGLKTPGSALQRGGLADWVASKRASEHGGAGRADSWLARRLQSLFNHSVRGIDGPCDQPHTVQRRPRFLCGCS